jgi:hypothetical protein
VCPRTETELRAGNLARVSRTADRDLSDLGRLEYSFDKLAAIPFAGLRKQEAALQVNSSLGWKTDGEVHGYSWSQARRRDCLAGRYQVESIKTVVQADVEARDNERKMLIRPTLGGY